jgi:hypothetical protein
MMIVFNIGAEEEHAAVIFTDLRKSHHLGEKLARAFEILDFENEVANAFDSERHKNNSLLRLLQTLLFSNQ